MRPRAPRKDLATIPPAQWAIAKERERVLRIFVREGRPLTPADTADAARQLGVSVQWARRLLKRYADDPRTSALVPDGGGRRPGSSMLDRRVEAVIARCIGTHYATAQRPPIRMLVEAVTTECRRGGFSIPAPKTIRRRLQSTDPTALMAKREGRQAARARHAPSAKHYAPAARPLQLIQIDHTRADIVLVDDTYREPIGRPWLTLAIDVFSRVVVGYYVTLEAPSSLSVALCLAHIVGDKAPMLARLGIDAVWPWGLPETLHLDNASEFRAAALVRACEEHGIEVVYRPVATPHYGGHIERLVGTVMGEVHLLPGTTFSNVADRGSYDSEGRATMTLTDFDAWLTRQIAVLYHGGIHRGIDRTPLGAWQEAISTGTIVRQVADPERVRIDFLPAELRKPRRDGIALFKIGYWHDMLPALAARSTASLPVRYDPRDLSRVWLRPPGEDAYLELHYKDLRRPPVTLWDWRAARQHLLGQGRREIDAAARFEAVEAQRELVAAAAQKTKAARRATQRTISATAAVARQGLPVIPPEGGQGGIDYSRPPEILEVEEWS
jgi:putative transposase